MKYLKWLILLIIVIVLICFLCNPHKEEKVKPKEKVDIQIADKKIGYLNIHNIHISEVKGYYLVTAQITNLSADIIESDNIEIVVNDADDKYIITLIGYFGGNILGDETKNIVIKTKENLSKAQKLDFKIN